MTASPVAFSAAGAPATAAGGERPKLEHAYLELRDPPRDGNVSKPGPRVGRIDFQFNPKELTLAKSAKWKRDTQRENSRSGVPEFTGSDPSKLTLEMFLDATEKNDTRVVDAVEALFACCVPTRESLDAKKPSPPWVIFHWGGLTGFAAYVSSVSVKYTLFTAGGLPVRGIATVTVEEIAGKTPGQNPTSGALAAHKVHTVLSGDTLASLAWREYGDAGAWRAIARANDIDDPMRLQPGQTLLLPAPDTLQPAGGTP